MAGSRLEKLGTVFTSLALICSANLGHQATNAAYFQDICRVRDLLRAGVMKPNEKPVWYDVYAAFPPKREPLYEKPARRMRNPPDNVPTILYKEDVIRAKFYEAYGSGPRAFELSRTNFKSTCQRFVEEFSELQKQGELDEDKLFEEAGKALLADGIILRRKGTRGIRPQQPTESENQDQLLEINLKSMLQEMQHQQQNTPNETEKDSTT